MSHAPSILLRPLTHHCWYGTLLEWSHVLSRHWPIWFYHQMSKETGNLPKHFFVARFVSWDPYSFPNLVAHPQASFKANGLLSVFQDSLAQTSNSVSMSQPILRTASRSLPWDHRWVWALNQTTSECLWPLFPSIPISLRLSAPLSFVLSRFVAALLI